MADGKGGFLVKESDGTTHLPTTQGGKISHSLMGDAWAALHDGFRGNKYEGPGKDTAIAKLRALYKREGMTPPGEGDSKESAEKPEGNDPDNDGDDDAVPGGDTDHDQGKPREASFEPGPGDLHADTTIGQTNQSGRKKSVNHFARRLVAGLKERMAQRGWVSRGEFDEVYRSALGHAGGKGKAARRSSAETAQNIAQDVKNQTNPDYGMAIDIPCDSCRAGNIADCYCPGCLAEDECWCCAGMQHAEHTSPESGINDGMVGDGGEANGVGRRVDHREPDVLVSTNGEKYRLFQELGAAFRFAVAPDWIPYLPKPGTYSHPKYGEVGLTADRIVDMVNKFNQGVYQTDGNKIPVVPIDGEHDTKATGAMGWIRELRLNEDGSADARVEWTDRGRAMLDKERYKFFSPEWYDEWTQPETDQVISNVAIGGALTTRPFFKTNSQSSALRPLVASERGYSAPDDDAAPAPPAGVAEDKRPSGGEGTTVGNMVQMTEEEVQALRQQAAESKALTERLTVAEAQAKQASEAIRAMEAANRRRAFAESAKTWAGNVDEIVSFMENLSATDLEWFMKREQAYANQIKESGLFREIGSARQGATDNPQAMLDSKVRTRMAEKKIPYAKAAAEILREEPGLAQQAAAFSEVKA